MTLNSLLNKLNYFSGKDKRGKTFKITEFNDLLPTVQDMLVNEELNKLLVEDIKNIPAARVSISPLRVFKKSEVKTVDDGSFQLPDDYVRYINVQKGLRNIDVVTEDTFNSKRSSVFRRPTVRPFCYISATDLMICPTNIGSTELQYFRKATVPYFDYCQDAVTLNEIFMPVGSVVRVGDDGQISLFDSAGTLIKQEVTHASAQYPHVSQTVELEWEPIYHDKFVLSMLALVGINIQMSELTQYAEGKKNA